MSNLTPLWRLLETRPSRTAVMTEWQTVAGDSLPAIRPLLQPIDRAATAYPNPRPNGRPLKVVRHGNGSIVAIDHDDWQNRFELQPSDVVLHQLDLRALRKVLCSTLTGVNIVKTAVNQSSTCLQIGNWEPKKAATFPVHLLLCQHGGILRRQILELQARCTRPGAILLTPTRTNWDGKIEGIAPSQKMMLAAICEIMEPEDAAFQETLVWEDYLQAFCQMVKLTLPSNYRNKRPIARRASLMAKAEKLKNAMVEHIRAARDGVAANIDAGNGPRLVRFLTKTHLAKLAGLQPYHVTRCFAADPQLRRLYQIANDPEELLRFGK